MIDTLREFMSHIMLIIDRGTRHLSVSFVSMTIFGQINFWSISTVTLLMWASIKLLRALCCPKHRKLSHRKFPSGGNTWWTVVIRVSKLCWKVVWLPWQHTQWLIGGTEIFWMENYQKEMSWSRNSKLQAVLKISFDFGKGARCSPWHG